MFRSNITIGKISGIPIRLHISFLLILPFFTWVIGSNLSQIAQLAGVAAENVGMNPYLIGFILAVLLFTSVTLHEVSHSLVARSKGVAINSITLMLLGGVAQMDEEFENPRDEAMMALAGPMFSLAFGLFLLFIVRPLAAGASADLRVIIFYLGFINIFLAIFNLLPAFPSDGGRVLRSVLAIWTTHYRATQIAASVGKAFAVLFGIYGFISGNIILMLIAFFIYIGASQEQDTSMKRDIFADFTVSDLMTEDVVTINEETTVDELLDMMMEKTHSGYPVVDSEGNLTGCITLDDIRDIPNEDQKLKNINEVMACDVITAHPDDDLFDAFKKMAKSNIGRLMVVEDGELVGILTRTDIMRAYQLKEIKERRK